MLFDGNPVDPAVLDVCDQSSFGTTRKRAECMGDLLSPSGWLYHEIDLLTSGTGYNTPLRVAKAGPGEYLYLHPDLGVWIQGTPRVEVKVPAGYPESMPGVANLELYDRDTGVYLGVIPGHKRVG